MTFDPKLENRSGNERRKLGQNNFHLPERRSGKDRRRTPVDRRGDSPETVKTPPHEPVVYYSDLGESLAFPDSMAAA